MVWQKHALREVLLLFLIWNLIAVDNIDIRPELKILEIDPFLVWVFWVYLTIFIQCIQIVIILCLNFRMIYKKLISSNIIKRNIQTITLVNSQF